MSNLPKVFTDASLLTEIMPYIEDADNLLSQAGRAVIDSNEAFAHATDFVKLCNTRIKVLDENRQALVRPLNAHVSWINGKYKDVTKDIETAKRDMLTKGTAWKIAEDARVQDEADEARRIAEEQALVDAQEAIDQGDQDKAEAIIESAAETPQKPEKAAPVRGSYTGASGSITNTWTGDVVDIKALCAGVANGTLPANVIAPSKAAINKVARSREVEGVFCGINIVKKKTMSVR